MTKCLNVTTRNLPQGMPFISSGRKRNSILFFRQNGASGDPSYGSVRVLPFLSATSTLNSKERGLVIKTLHQKYYDRWHERSVLLKPNLIIAFVYQAKPKALKVTA